MRVQISPEAESLHFTMKELLRSRREHYRRLPPIISISDLPVWSQLLLILIIFTVYTSFYMNLHHFNHLFQEFSTVSVSEILSWLNSSIKINKIFNEFTRETWRGLGSVWISWPKHILLLLRQQFMSCPYDLRDTWSWSSLKKLP